MQISKETLTILQNFSKINPNLLLPQGNTIRTMASGRHIIAQANVKEAFPVQYGIYDLNEFLGILNLFKEPDLEFSDDGNTLTIRGENGRVKYFAADKNALDYPEKDIQEPDWEVGFDLPADTLQRIHKAAGALGSPHLSLRIAPEDDKASLVVTDIHNKSSNSFDLEVPVDTNNLEEEQEFIWKIEALMFIPGNYRVCVSTKTITKFTGNEATYWVALLRT